MRRLNGRHQEAHEGEGELAARIESFELAYRMQMVAPGACSTSAVNPRRSAASTDWTTSCCSHFAKQCLMARRLVERGVRFVQIYSGGMENERSWGRLHRPR